MPRNANDVLFGGGRAFVNNQDIGWLAEGEIKLEEQSSSTVIKESEGATVVTVATDREVHMTFAMLEYNLDTLRLINPAYRRKVYTDSNATATDELIADLGKSASLKNIPVVDLSSLKVEPATTLVSAAMIDDTVLYVENIRKFAASDTITLVRGATSETATVNSVDASQGSITLGAGLAHNFAAGSIVKITTTAKAYALGTDFYFYPTLGLIQRAGDSVNALDGDGAAVSYSYHSSQGTGFIMASDNVDDPFKFEFWHKHRDGKYRCIRAPKAKISGNFAPFSITQDAESPLNLDLILLQDDDLGGTYEIIDYADGSAAPNGGW